jgi:hypothetical protein
LAGCAAQPVLPTPARSIEDIHAIARSENGGHLAAERATHAAGRDVETTTAKLTVRPHEEAAGSKNVESV